METKTMQTTSINKIQQLNFELIRNSSFNDFDGNKVVDDLIENRDLWIGVIMDRFDLIKLRDISDNLWNIDTMFISCHPDKAIQLKNLAENWKADEISFLRKSQKCFDPNLYGIAEEIDMSSYGCIYENEVLRVWWD